jgi:hypothetical protein
MGREHTFAHRWQYSIIKVVRIKSSRRAPQSLQIILALHARESKELNRKSNEYILIYTLSLVQFSTRDPF